MRRPIVIAPVLALLVVLVVLGVRGAAVGDDDRAAAAVERYGLAVGGRDVRVLCGQLLSGRITTRLQRAGYPCERTLAAALAPVVRPTLRVLGSEVDDAGIARVRVRTGAEGQAPADATLVLRREEGTWRITSLGDALGGDGRRRAAAPRSTRRGGPPEPPLTPGVVPLVTVPEGADIADGIVPSGRLPAVPSGPARPTGRRGDRNARSAGGRTADREDLERAARVQGERSGE